MTQESRRRRWRPHWIEPFNKITDEEKIQATFPSITADQKQLRRGVHRSTGELEAAIKAYIDATNAAPKPFRWTKSADDILVAINRFCKRTIDEQLKNSESGH
jgi:hypothetical protein